jgi:rhamnosyltransferase
MNFPNKYILCIIVIYNPVLKILNDLISKLNNTYIQIVIIDNSNCNELSSLNHDSFYNLTYEKLKFNHGLPWAQNYAFKKYASKSHKYVLFFDQDSLINDQTVPNLLLNLIRLNSAGLRVAAAGPLLLDINTNYCYPVFSDEFKKTVMVEQKDEPIEVSFLISSGLLIAIDCFHIIGPPNPDFFIDYFDIDWCFRAKNKGFLIFIIPSSSMLHSPGDSTINFMGRHIPNHLPYRKYYQIRNLLHMIKMDYVPFWWKRRELVSIALKFTISFYFSDQKFKFLRYTLKGFLDGINSNFGKKVI